MVFQDPMSSLDPRMRVARHRRGAACRAGAGRHRTRVVELLRRGRACPRRRRPLPPPVLRRSAAAHLHRPRALAPAAVILADEPVSALDVSVRAQVLNLISDLVDELELPWSSSRTTSRWSATSATASP